MTIVLPSMPLPNSARLAFFNGISFGSDLLDRRLYIESIGGPLPKPCVPEVVILGNVEGIDGCTVKRAKFRLLSDEEAHKEYGELQKYRGLIEGLKNPKDTDHLRELYKIFSRDHEMIAYDYGTPLFRLSDLANMDAVLKQHPPEELLAITEKLYKDTLEFYTWTDGYIGYPADMHPDEKLPVIVEFHQANAQYDLGSSEAFGLQGQVDYKATSQPNPDHAVGPVFIRDVRTIVIAANAQGFERRHPIRQPLEDEIQWVEKEIDGKMQTVAVKTGAQILSKNGGLQFERWADSGDKPLIRHNLAEGLQLVRIAASLPNVDDRRIGVDGSSLGGQIAAHVAAFGQDIEVVDAHDNKKTVDVTAANINCGLVTDEAKGQNAETYHNETWKRLPSFKHKQLMQMRTSPIAVSTVFGGCDVLTADFDPIVQGFSDALDQVPGGVYKNSVDPYAGHGRTPAMLNAAVGFFKQHLPPSSAPVPKVDMCPY